MLKVLIIDDEPNVRRGLKTIINWQEYGYSICGDAANGEEGLAKVEELRPDLILADIKMPYVNGLQMIENIRERKIDCKIIILSGYNDFEYAKSAIKFGVSSYLLKPVEEEELIKNIIELKETINRERETKVLISSGKKVAKNEMLRALITSNDGEAAKERNREDATLYLECSSFVIALQELGNCRHSIRLDQIEEMLLEEKNVEAFEFNGAIILLLKGNSQQSNSRILNRLSNRLKKEYNCDAFTAVGREVDSITRIRQSYEDAVAILQNKFYHEHEALVFYEDIKKRDSELKDKEMNDRFDLQQTADKLYVAVEGGDNEQVLSVIGEMTEYFMKNKLEKDRVKGIYVSLIAETCERLQENYVSMKEHYNIEAIIQGLYKTRNLTELRKYALEILNDLSKQMLSNNSDSVIKRIIDFIKKNLDKDLKLETVSEIFGYSSAYLGKLFKSQTGEYYNNYLDKLKIEYSKELLLKGYRTVEVAKKTGFKNTDYFYSKFKKYEGIGPSEFKKLNLL